MRHRKAAALCLALCLAFGGTGCGTEKTAVYVQQVSDLTGFISGERFSGMVVSEHIAEVKKDSDKKVAELLVKEGMDVKEGDPLFTYDTDQLQLAADKLDLEREQLNASMEDYEVQIGKLERERDKAKADQKLQYTIQIQTLMVSKQEAELNLRTKSAELEKARKLLDNATVMAPVTGRIQSVNENGTDSQGNPAAYITIQQAGSYRVKGVIGELQQGAMREGQRVRMISRVNDSQSWLGTVTLVDYENPIKQENDRGMISDTMTTASKYPFYVELDSIEGLIMGQHLYLEPDNGGTGTGIPLDGGYICYDEGGAPYVWAENNRGKLEKRAITLGQYEEETNCYYVTAGLGDTDYIAFPDDTLCKPGAATSHTPVAAEPEMGQMEEMEEADIWQEAMDALENGEIDVDDLEAAAERAANGEIPDEQMEKLLEGGVG